MSVLIHSTNTKYFSEMLVSLISWCILVYFQRDKYYLKSVKLKNVIYVLVPLLMLGDSCGYEDHCQDDNAVCDVDGFCSCVGGYRPVYGKCGK